MSATITVCGQQFPFEDDPIPMWIFDQGNLAFLAVNPSAIQHYGFSRDQFLHMTILDIRPVEDVPKILLSALHPRHKGPTSNARWRHRRADGYVFDVDITSLELDFDGKKAELVWARPVASDPRRANPSNLNTCGVGIYPTADPATTDPAEMVPTPNALERCAIPEE